MTWPFLPENLIYVGDKPPSPEQIIILYFPNSGANFLANVLSCSPSLYGDDFVNYVIEMYSDGYDPTASHWNRYEGKYHPIFHTGHPRFYSFDFILNHPKLIYLNYSFSNKENKWLLFRRNYCKGTSLNDNLIDLQAKYEVEMLRYINDKNKDYHKIPLLSFLKPKQFALEVNNTLRYLNFDEIEETTIIKMHNVWKKLNMKQSGKVTPIPYHQPEEKAKQYFEISQFKN
jgi:hypothetical protein